MSRTKKKLSIYLLLVIMVISSVLTASPVFAETTLPPTQPTSTSPALPPVPPIPPFPPMPTNPPLPVGTVTAAASVSEDNKVITISFATALTSIVEDLKANITLKKADSEQYAPLEANDAVSFSSTESTSSLTITLATALTGSGNTIKITPNSFKDAQENPNSNEIIIENIEAHDISPPTYVGTNTWGMGENLRIYFDEEVIINTLEDDILTLIRSNISVAADGEHFVPLLEQSDVEFKDNIAIEIEYYNDMKIVSGPNTIIRIAAGTLMDAGGNLNEEINIHVSPPLTQSTEISSDNHDVVITFNEAILDFTSGNLKNYIELVKVEDSIKKGLVESDTATIEDGKLYIHFTEALSGLNQISIDGEALMSISGDIQGDEISTALIQANVGGVDPAPADTTMPKFLDAYISSSGQELHLIFNEDIHNAAADVASFLKNVEWHNSSQWKYELPADATVTFEGAVATIHFATPLTGYQYYFSFAGNHFKDTAGNILNQSVNTNWMYPQTEIKFNDGYLSNNGKWLSLEAQSTNQLVLVDQTLLEGVSQLKEQITISLDQGLTYHALDTGDVVSLVDDKINIIFHERKKVGSIKVKIAEGVVSDLYDTKRNSAIDLVIAYNTPEITGYLMSNAASVFEFADNDLWRSKVSAVGVSDDDFDNVRMLNSSEYTLSEGKIIIAKGIFLEGREYEIFIDAEGYSTKYFEGMTYKSSEIFYMTAPEVTTENGITAKINVFNNAKGNNYYYDNALSGTQAVVFVLFNGSTPVSVVAANLNVETGKYSANFNVSDADTNPNYTVRAYIVSKYSNDPTNLGVNLATVKTQLELEQAIMNASNNNQG